MARLSIEEIIETTGGERLRGQPDALFTTYSIDSRTLQPGDLFIALRGPRFDGADFLPQAVEKGAGGVLVMKPPDPAVCGNAAVIRVDDTLEAMQRLAAHIRRRRKLRVIGITGSTGKTTTKELAAALLASRFRTSASPGNLNNLYGLPLAFLSMSDDAEVMVCEMGMSTKGEISALCGIAAPDTGVITNIYPVHLEFFSSVQEIALAKKELLQGLDPDGLAVINADNALVRNIASDFPGRQVRFSLEGNGDYNADRIRSLGFDGTSFTLAAGGRTADFRLPLPGKHNVANALAALAVSAELGASLDKMRAVLSGIRPMPGRGRCIPAEKGFHIIDDAYNSNPAALSNAAAMLAGMTGAGRKVLVAGDMLELGREAPSLHRRAGEEIAGLGIDILVGVGPLAARICEGALSGGMPKAHVFSLGKTDEAVPLLRAMLQRGDIVLIKGSRAVGLDAIIKALAERACLKSS
jgi:UDP-N-acetylmuramoyl-tripeptide--D-alanyl-D-alanine ligase